MITFSKLIRTSKYNANTRLSHEKNLVFLDLQNLMATFCTERRENFIKKIGGERRLIES